MGYHIVGMERQLSPGHPLYSPSRKDWKIVDTRFHTFSQTVAEIVADAKMFAYLTSMEELLVDTDHEADDPFLINEDIEYSINRLAELTRHEAFTIKIAHSYDEDECAIIDHAQNMVKTLDLAMRAGAIIVGDPGEVSSKIKSLNAAIVAMVEFNGPDVKERFEALNAEIEAAQHLCDGQVIER